MPAKLAPWSEVVDAVLPLLTSFPCNKNEKSLHFPTQSETKNTIIFSYNICQTRWSGLETWHTINVAILRVKIKITCVKQASLYLQKAPLHKHMSILFKKIISISSKTSQHLSQQILNITLATLQLVAIHKAKVSVIEPTASEFSDFLKYVFLALTCKCLTLWLTSKLPGKFSRLKLLLPSCTQRSNPSACFYCYSSQRTFFQHQQCFWGNAVRL